MEVNQLLIYSRKIPAREGEYVSYPEQMSEELKGYLQNRGINQLYSHQADMYQAVRNGENAVITTSTASGKTLSFLLPVLEGLLEDPSARAIFLYPTKALAADQLRAITPIISYFGDNKISAGVYDGDTSPQERSRIRRHCNIILTNPEMLNGAFLPNHSRYGFDFLFANLKYVVMDEMHTYRGVFGSHIANLMRRLHRICRYYHCTPQFLCSSATIANPVELAAELCGEDFTLIDRDGSPAGERVYAFLQPPRLTSENDTYIGQVQASTVAAELVTNLIEDRHSLIAFCKSRRGVEVVLREAREQLDAAGFLGASDRNLIAGYRGGYTPLERKNIEKRMISGELKGLVSTNALELGIDIGAVDSTVLVGYPGTRASFWQQTGRAGRTGKGCINYLILESLPMDQYVAMNPKWLFEQGNENAVVDPDNLLIELAHLRAAAAEIPLTIDDAALFPDLGESIPVLLQIGELTQQKGRFAWNGNAYPAGDFSMRNMDERRYKLMDDTTHTQITEMDELQAFREAHEGAIYLHEGKQYQVIRLDQTLRTAYAVPFEGNYYTMPGGTTEVKIIKEQDAKAFYQSPLAWGDVNVEDVIYMYKKLQFHNHQNLGWDMIPEPLSKDYDTESMWMRIPPEITEEYRKLLQEDGQGRLVRNNHFDGLCHALGAAVRMITMAEQEDIGVTMSANAIGFEHYKEEETNPDNDIFLYVYDKFVGGLGYAQKAYDNMEEILEGAVNLVAGCPCKDGCAACVGDYKLDKKMVLWGLRSLKEKTKAPAYDKKITFAPRKNKKRMFRFKDLQKAENWRAFTQYLQQKNQSTAAFLSSVEQVQIAGDELIIPVKSMFLQEWIMTEENYRAMETAIKSATDAPATLRITAIVSDADEQKSMKREDRLKGKLQRRYDKEQEET